MFWKEFQIYYETDFSSNLKGSWRSSLVLERTNSVLNSYRMQIFWDEDKTESAIEVISF